MANPKLQQFDRQLKQVVVPALACHGFTLQPRRTFRRKVRHDQTESIQIIEFQVGNKHDFIGRFTVNLAIYNAGLRPDWRLQEPDAPHSWDCLFDLTQRLGFFYEPPLGFVNKLLRRAPSAKYDHWWDQSADAVKMATTLAAVSNLIVTEGVRWLSERTSSEGFQWALEELQRRKTWKESLGSPGAEPTFTSRPFPGSHSRP